MKGSVAARGGSMRGIIVFGVGIVEGLTGGGGCTVDGINGWIALYCGEGRGTTRNALQHQPGLA